MRLSLSSQLRSRRRGNQQSTVHSPSARTPVSQSRVGDTTGVGNRLVGFEDRPLDRDVVDATGLNSYLCTDMRETFVGSWA
jgi:hypothetical protein